MSLLRFVFFINQIHPEIMSKIKLDLIGTQNTVQRKDKIPTKSPKIVLILHSLDKEVYSTDFFKLYYALHLWIKEQCHISYKKCICNIQPQVLEGERGKSTGYIFTFCCSSINMDRKQNIYWIILNNQHNIKIKFRLCHPKFKSFFKILYS